MTFGHRLVFLSMVAAAATARANGAAGDLMPLPASMVPAEGAMAVTAGFAVSTAECRDARVAAAAARAVRRVAAQTGQPLVAGDGIPALAIRCGGDPHAVQQAVEDESYTLSVTPQGARLEAPAPYGALRGLETFLQLIEPGPDGWQVRATRIEDRPRFPWRGLLVDSCRHFMPVEALKRNLDAMAAVKLNVLHWHLSENQGFRVESRKYPRLHELGSDGEFYTQAEIKDVVAYARDRGIRVMPEFDLPGHSTAWFVGHPELAAAPGPYSVERGWGVFDPTMDPTREEVYRFLDRFFGEMAGLFPDPYVHVGGDEVNGKQWDASPGIAAFKKARGIESNAALQAQFNSRLEKIVSKHGKKMVGWDEILEPSLPKDIVVQSWRGPASLAEAASRGFSGILSSGWYLDYMLPAATHYAVDPFGKQAAALPADARARILGGEACMWNEFVTAEMLDGRIWPRMAAIAERLWSPAAVTDVDDMYRRLESQSQRLDALGLTHRTGPRRMLLRLAAGRPPQPLEAFAALLEPVKNYERPRTRAYTSRTPLNRLVDAVPPESDAARRFARLVDRFLASGARGEGREEIAETLAEWSRLRQALEPVLAGNPMLAEAEPIAADLSAAAAAALRALDGASGPVVEDASLLSRLASPRAELLLQVASPIRKLVESRGEGKLAAILPEAR